MKPVVIIGGKAQPHHFPKDGYPDHEIWCLNGITKPKWLPRFDRHFNIHFYDRLIDYGYDVERDQELSKDNPNVPFYTADKWPDGTLVKPEIFPAHLLAANQPGGWYHCGSFDWMVAYATYRGAPEIILHGIGLCLEAGEPLSARACLEYWCGYAEGRGSKIEIASDCDIFKFYHLVQSNMVYGYDDTPIMTAMNDLSDYAPKDKREFRAISDGYVPKLEKGKS